MNFKNQDIISIHDFSKDDLLYILKISKLMEKKPKPNLLKDKILATLFFEPSTRTRLSFTSAMEQLGGKVMGFASSTMTSIKKGETLWDTMKMVQAYADIVAIRHPLEGSARLAAESSSKPVINAGDGSHEHPTQALLDALTIRRRLGRLSGLIVAISGDIIHSRVARSNILLLNTMGARVRVIAPPTLLPVDIERMGVEVHYDMAEGLQDVDIVMMLRLQTERMQGTYVPSIREYFRFYGLDREKLAYAKPDALIMHPGPMNRGVEIDTEVADDIHRSVIREQVEMGVAVRMAVLDLLARRLRNTPGDVAA